MPVSGKMPGKSNLAVRLQCLLQLHLSEVEQLTRFFPARAAEQLRGCRALEQAQLDAGEAGFGRCLVRAAAVAVVLVSRSTALQRDHRRHRHWPSPGERGQRPMASNRATGLRCDCLLRLKENDQAPPPAVLRIYRYPARG